MLVPVETTYEDFDRDYFLANPEEEPVFQNDDSDPIVTIPDDFEGDMEQPETMGLPWHFTQPSEDAWRTIWQTVENYLPYVVMANLDTGCNPHNNLPKPLYMGSYIRGQSAFDGNGHGTHTIGTSVGTGGYGVAPGAQYIVLKVLSNGGSGSSSGIAAANEFCGEWRGSDGLQVDCVNMSLGGGSRYAPTVNAIKSNFSKGIITAAAAGNAGPSNGTVGWPARDPEVPAIGATRSDGNIASFSSRGPQVLIAAPGQGIVSTSYRSESGFLTMSGTSMATPFITGMNALLIAMRRACGLPNWRSIEPVENAYKAYAEDRGPQGRDNSFGYGVLKYDKMIEDMARFGTDFFLNLGS